MRVAVTSNGSGLDAPASPVFGRCQTVVFVDTDSLTAETVGNPAIGAPGGAGIQAAQFIIEHGAQALITGNVGPNAFQVLQAAGVPIYMFNGGTVREAVAALKAGQLPSTGDATAPLHAGMRAGGGMGRGMGGGRGVGMGGGFGAPVQPPAAAPAGPTRAQEIGELRQIASDLRAQLADVLERIDRLEKGE